MWVVIRVTHFSDPGCPWAYSAGPAFAVLHWRYGSQLEWRHVMIGLGETREHYLRRGTTGESQARNYRSFRRRGMPFATEPRERPHATWPMCRVVVAARRLAPEREWAVFRALQLAQFTSTLALDEPAGIEAALAWVPGIDAAALVAASTEPETEELFAADRALARIGGGRRDRVPGPLGDHPRGRDPLHRAEPVVHGGRRAQPRGRRLPAARGVRRRDREPRPLAGAAGTGRGRRRSPRGVPGRADHVRGRGRDGEAPARPGPRGGRGRADLGRRLGCCGAGGRSATTRCGRPPRLPPAPWRPELVEVRMPARRRAVCRSADAWCPPVRSRARAASLPMR